MTSFFNYLTETEIAALLLSLRVSFLATLCILVPAVCLGYIMAHKSFWAKSLVNVVCHLPLILPPVVVGYFLLYFLGKQGLLGSFLYKQFGLYLPFHEFGAVIACAIVSFPLFLRTAQSAFHLEDPQLKDAASSLGAHPIRVFFTISIPQAFSGLLSGFVLAWGRSLGEFGATITFVSNMTHTRTIPLAIYTELQKPSFHMEDGAALRLIFLSVCLSILCLVVSECLQKQIDKKRKC